MTTLSPSGDANAAGTAESSSVDEARAAISEGRTETAEALLRRHLADHPADVSAIALLSDTLLRRDRTQDAEILLAGHLAQMPGAVVLRERYATVLFLQNRTGDAIGQLDELLRLRPESIAWRSQKASAYASMGRFPESLAVHEELLANEPAVPAPWLDYARTLRIAGRPEEAITAYWRTIGKFSQSGQAWWDLASEVGVRFAPHEIDLLRSRLAQPNLAFENRAQLQFALGWALEDSGLYAEAFAEYRAANLLMRSTTDYQAERTSAHVANCKSVLTETFFEEHSGGGFQAGDPIFLVGMPRTRATLIEKILSSHTAIGESIDIPVLIYLAERISRTPEGAAAVCYPEVLHELDMEQCRALGEEYLERTRIQRRGESPFFIDSVPENFAHIGLIRRLLPRAKIVDVRRHPLGSCFSSYRHYFAKAGNFTYGLIDLGRYYSDYVELMDHFGHVLPEGIHQVNYEDMIENPEEETRRLFSYLGLPCEDQCLRHARLAAREREGVNSVGRIAGATHPESWRNFEEWLAPMKCALGPVLDAYPAVPIFPRRGLPVNAERDTTRDRQLWSLLQPVRATLPRIVGWRQR